MYTRNQENVHRRKGARREQNVHNTRNIGEPAMGAVSTLRFGRGVFWFLARPNTVTAADSND